MILGRDFEPGSMLPRLPVKVRCGNLEVDRVQRSARIAGSELELTPREHAVLLCLADHVNRVIRRSELLEKIWSVDKRGSNVLEVYVRRLRRKLGMYGIMVETIRGFGYRLRPGLCAFGTRPIS